MKKTNRLLSNDDFKKVIDKKKFISNKSFAVYYLPNHDDKIRVGISIGKKFGHAVLRNKAKRQIRSILQEITDIKDPYDIVVVVRSNYDISTYQENYQELAEIYQKIIRKGATLSEKKK